MGEASQSAPPSLRFGVYEVDLQAGELRRKGRKLKLQEQPFQVLALLLEHPGEVVTREALREKLWPADTFVEFDHSLNTAISKIREALGDLADNPRFVETLPRRGYRFIAPVEGLGQAPPAQAAPEVPTAPVRRARFQPAWLAALAVVALLAVLLGLNVGGLRERLLERGASATLAAKPSIAVLPFQNLSPDPDNEYFSDGMTEEITSKLSRIQSLQVVARTSTARFKGTEKDIKVIGEELGVRYVLEGSVRKAGNRVRITAQLIDTSTGFNLWAEDFEGDLRDVFAAQEETALKIADALNLQLTSQEQQAVQHRYTQNPEAYNAYLQGWALTQSLLGRFDRPEKLEAARQHFERALALDPDYPLALAGLAEVEALSYFFELDGDPGQLQRADQLARRALALDPNLPEAHVALGDIHGSRREWALAVHEFRRALRLDSNNAYAWEELAWALNYQQPPDPEGAERAARQAIRLQPGWFWSFFQLGEALHHQARYREAIAAWEYAVQLSPDFRAAHVRLGEVYLDQNDYNEALTQFSQARQLGETPGLLVRISAAYAGLGDKEKSLAELEKALAAGYRDFAYLDSSPYFDSLRSDPRFQDLLRRMNFPE